MAFIFDEFANFIDELELEVEEEQRVEVRRLQRKRLRDSTNPFDYPNRDFLQNFRLSKNLLWSLVVRLEPHLQSERVYGLTASQKVLTAVKFLANGSYQRGSVAEHGLLHVAQSTVSKCLHQFLDAMELEVNRNVLTFPATRAARDAVKQGFYEKHNIPGVVGAIDCTHVKLKRPREHEEQYFCHKFCHCINVQLICDSDMRILGVNARHGGATHDAFIWRFSTVNQFLQDLYARGETNTWLIGDSGYPLSRFLMTPIIGAAPETPEANYTAIHISARNVIERLNGVLKSRWRCLSGERTLHYDPETVAQMVASCCALHNIGLHDQDYVPQPRRLPAIPRIQFLANQSELNRGQIVRAHLVNLLPPRQH